MIDALFESVFKGVNESFEEYMEEDAPVNCAGGGAIAGIGIGPQGEPGVPTKRKKKPNDRQTRLPSETNFRDDPSSSLIRRLKGSNR